MGDTADKKSIFKALLGFASIALSKRANIDTVSKMLGHSSIKITLDVYGHLMPGMQKAALSTLDGVFS